MFDDFSIRSNWDLAYLLLLDLGTSSYLRGGATLGDSTAS